MTSGVGQREDQQMGTCSAMCGKLHDLCGGAKGGGAEGGQGYTCSRQVQQEALDGLGVQEQLLAASLPNLPTPVHHL